MNFLDRFFNRISSFEFLFCLSIVHCSDLLAGLDQQLTESLTPYMKRHGSYLHHRAIRDCHAQEHGSVPHELFTAHQLHNISSPYVEVQRFVKRSSTLPFQIIRGHYVKVLDPLKTLSVFEPHQKGGCSLSIRETVQESAKNYECTVAVNAGYFDTKRGTCHGNVISNGKLVQDSKGIQNAHFGVTKDGQIFEGYLSEEEVLSGKFKQLVGGVVWILKNGEKYVNISKQLECEDTEETGPMDRFVEILSARTAIGHDKEGNVVIVQVDGKSDVDGVNLHDMEDLLQGFGLVNAINLDGGGSSTLVVNGATVNYPYDECGDKSFSCDRKVSTIICIHPPYCEPADCSGHGICEHGKCSCNSNWMEPDCSRLFCGLTNCSGNGVCTAQGCVCHPGYFGRECNQSCPTGWFGSMCTERCDCTNSHGCSSYNGSCFCKKGFTGSKCENVCNNGFHGENCLSKCMCHNACFCDPVTGSCDVPRNSTLYKSAQCIAESMIPKTDRETEFKDEKKKWFITMVVLGVITALCLSSFLLLLCCSCSCRCYNEQVFCSRAQKKYKKYRLQLPSGYISDSPSDNESLPMKNLQRS